MNKILAIIISTAAIGSMALATEPAKPLKPQMNWAGGGTLLALRIAELAHERRQHGKNRFKRSGVAAPLRQPGIRQAARHLGAGRRVDRLGAGASSKAAHLFTPG